MKSSRPIAWENSQHFMMPPTVFQQNDVWETSTEIPYWWRVTTQVWVVLLIGHAASAVWNFSGYQAPLLNWNHLDDKIPFSSFLCCFFFCLSFILFKLLMIAFIKFMLSEQEIRWLSFCCVKSACDWGWKTIIIITVKTLLSSHLLSGHRTLISRLSKSQNNDVEKNNCKLNLY